MNPKQIRDLGIALLDDEDGINETAYQLLAQALTDSGNEDVLAPMKADNGRYYLGEDDAQDLREPKAIEVPVEVTRV